MITVRLDMMVLPFFHFGLQPNVKHFCIILCFVNSINQSVNDAKYFLTGIGGLPSMPPLTAVAPVPIASIPVVGMSPPLVSSVPTAAVPPLANGAPAVIQPLPAFGHPGMLQFLILVC